MSGHSKWSQIKRKKGITAAKRGQIFTKLLRAISVSAKLEPNPQFNPNLRSAIDKAKENNVPSENIERAIKKSQEVKDVETLIIEAYGPEGIAILIEATTNNKNRSISEIKKILSDHNTKWADPGSVLWAFEKKDGTYQTKFPQKISDETNKKLLELLEKLDDCDDVDDIHTSAEIE